MQDVLMYQRREIERMTKENEALKQDNRVKDMLILALGLALLIMVVGFYAAMRS